MPKQTVALLLTTLFLITACAEINEPNVEKKSIEDPVIIKQRFIIPIPERVIIEKNRKKNIN